MVKGGDGSSDSQLQAMLQSPRTQVVSITKGSHSVVGPTETDSPIVPGYEIIGELGRGGMGVVYIARQISLKRLVALKMILAGAHAGATTLARFRTEAEAVARLTHPNIVPIFEIGEHQGRPFLCLEYVSGGSLEQKVAGRAQPERDAVQLVEALARAMHYTHQHGILHRDLKPNNVLLTSDGTPKITDFGLAKLMDDPDGPTRTETLIGTPNYMSPEQASGNARNIGVTSDVYSLGAVLYELLTGRVPFRGHSVMDTLQQVRNQEPVPPRRLRSSGSRDVETICLKCLEKDPGQRYPTAEALADDLRRFLDGKPIQARPIPIWQRLWRTVRRRPAQVLGVISLVCIAMACAWHFSISNQLAHHRAEEKYQRFVDRRNEAIFYGLLAPDQGQLFHGAEAHASLQMAESAAREALALAGVDPESAAPAVDSSIPSPRKADVASDCYALLLVLASVKGQQAQPEAGGAEQIQQALWLLESARKLGFETRAYYQRRAVLLKQTGENDEARRAEEQADTLPPNSALDFFLNGEEQYRRHNVEEAINSFNRALALQPTHFWAQFFLAACHLKVEHWEIAKTGLNACLSQRPDFVWAYLFRSFAHEKLQEPANAEADFQKALQLNPTEDARYVLYLTRGILRVDQNQLDQAESDFQAAIDLKPGQYNAYVNLALVYLRKGQFERAAAQEAIALGLRPPRSVVFGYHLERSRNLLRARRYEETIAECDVTLKLAPHQAIPYEVRARALLMLERFKEAEEAYDDFLWRGGAATSEVFRRRGLARIKLGKYPEAAEDFTRVVERAPSAENYRDRGWAYYFSDALKLAQRDFSKAIELAPESGDSYAGRGLSQVMLGQYRVAVEDAEAALSRKPATPEIMHNLACIFAQAALQADADSQRSDRQAVAAGYRARSLTCVQQTLAMVQPKERSAYWRNKISIDSALSPIRNEAEFKQLQEKHFQPYWPNR